MKVPSGLRIDSPSWPLLQAHISYWGIADAVGSVFGTTVVCGDLANEPSYIGLAAKLLDGDAAGQVRVIAAHVAGTNTLTVANAFTDNAGAVVQVVAGTRFVILSIAGGGAAPAPVVAPSIGLWMFGECAPGMAASLNTLVMPNLAGFPDDIFNNEFWIQVIHNADVPGTAPERQIRRVTDYVGASGTFTVDPFLNNVEANDLVAVFHESIMGIEVLGFGTLDTSNATVPADSTRPEGAGYFDGCLLMTTEGDVRFQPRRIVDFTAAGVFILDPGNPFTAAPGLVDYIIVGFQFRAIAPTEATYSHPSGVAEQTAFTIAITRPTEVKTIILDLTNLTQNADIRIRYDRAGVGAYPVMETFNWTVGMDDIVYFRQITCTHNVRVTVQSAIAEGVARDIPYEYSLRE